MPISLRAAILILLLAAWIYGAYRGARYRSVWQMHFFNPGGAGAFLAALTGLYVAQSTDPFALSGACLLLAATFLSLIVVSVAKRRSTDDTISTDEAKNVVLLFPAGEVWEGILVGAIVFGVGLWVVATA
jgi:hypothetical protein